jgi:Flp pilus assembly protein TadD
MSALALDPDEPTLHTLLGAIYTKTGLNEEAAMAFREATSLLGRRR